MLLKLLTGKNGTNHNKLLILKLFFYCRNSNFREMGVDITELDPYRRDTIIPKKYKLTPPQPVFKAVQSVHNGIDITHAAIDRRVVQPVKRIYNHVVNEQGWMKIGVIVGSTVLTRGVTKRLPLSFRIPIPATQCVF